MCACAYFSISPPIDPLSGRYVEGTYTPCIRHDEKNFLSAIYRLSPRAQSSIQLTRFRPCLHIRWAILQKNCCCADCILCPSQRLQYRDPPLPYTHICRVLAQYLLVPLKHLLELCIRRRSCFIVDAAECDDALVGGTEACFQALKNCGCGGLVAGAQGGVEEVFVDGPRFRGLAREEEAEGPGKRRHWRGREYKRRFLGQSQCGLRRDRRRWG